MSEPANDPGPSADLSDRQRACLILAGKGLSSKEIGRELGISPSTVDNHIHVAVAKLHARNRWHAAKLLDPDRTLISEKPETRAGILPPLGGRLNLLTGRQRATQIVAVAALALIVLTALYATILGAITVFSDA